MLLEQLSVLCRLQPTRAKWVFVPGYALGNTLGERLALEGVPWANVHFVTPLDVAVRMAGPYLVERGIEPSDEALGPALVMRLLLGLPGEEGYFRPMGDQPSMADALWRTLAELRLAGITSADPARPSFRARAKQQEVASLLAAFEQFLEDRRVADAAAVFAEARKGARYCPIGPHDARLEWPETIWPPLIQTFLDTLPGERLEVAPALPPRLPLPRRVSRRAHSQASPPAADRGASRLWYLMAPDLAPPSRITDADQSLQIFHAGGREAEIDEIVRRIAASGLPLDEVEIACASDAHALLSWEKAIRLGWPVTVASGIPAPLTRPGRALLGWCEWLETDLAASRLRRLLQSGDVAPRAWAEGQDADGAMTPGQGARLLLRAEAAWGRATYGAALTRLRASLFSRLDAGDRDEAQQERDRMMLRRLARLDAWIADLLDAIPLARDDGTVDVLALVAGARAFLGGNAQRASALDAAAFLALDDSLDELAGLGGLQAPLRAALRFLRERVASLRVGADRARPGHLHVSLLASAGPSGRGQVFLAGLEEGRVFPPAVEDPVLLDAERQLLDGALRLSSDRLDEAVHAVVTRLAAIGREARHGVCLSFSCRDTREFRETFPSWIVLQAFRVLRGETSLGYGDLGAWLGEPFSAVPVEAGQATTDTGWWLAHARCGARQAERAALRAFPGLARGRDALAQRGSPAFTAWDGRVPDAGRALDPTSRSHAVSASTLEDAAACPFRFFLRHGLGVEPLEAGERQPDAWLDPLTRGRELHDIFAITLRRIRREGRRPALEVDRPLILALGEERLKALARDLPPPSDAVFVAERDEFLYDLRLFIEAECRRPHGEPLAFEVTFGLPTDDPALEPLARPEPVTIPLGRGSTLRIRGRIDRVDRLADGTFETIDYKTGRFWPAAWQGTFAGGRRLQHALYGVAASAMLSTVCDRPAVARGTYYFPSARGLRQRRAIPTPEPARLSAVLRDLTSVLGAGAFTQSPDATVCRWCDFAAACGPSPWERAAVKTAAAEDLASFRDLQGHE